MVALGQDPVRKTVPCGLEQRIQRGMTPPPPIAVGDRQASDGTTQRSFSRCKIHVRSARFKQLLRPRFRLFRPQHVNLLGALARIREHDSRSGQDLEESATDSKIVLAGLGAGHKFPRFEHGHERHVTGKYTYLAVYGGQHYRTDVDGEDRAFNSDYLKMHSTHGPASYIA